MMCLRVLFGLSLIARAAFHVTVGIFAAKDLADLHDATSGTLKQFALRLTHISDVVKELEVPLVFYAVCGVGLVILACLYPWTSAHRSRVTVYAIFHVLYAAMEVYVVYVRTIMDVSFVREVYQYMTLPWLFPASLVLDVLTLLVACIPTEKSGSAASYTSIFPLNRVWIWHGNNMAVPAVPGTVSPSVPYQRHVSLPQAV